RYFDPDVGHLVLWLRAGVERHDGRYLDRAPRRELNPPVHAREERRGDMESFSEKFEHRAVRKSGQLSLLHEITGNPRDERSLGILVGNAIGRDGRRAVARSQGLPRLTIRLSGDRQTVGLLKRSQRAPSVGCNLSVD